MGTGRYKKLLLVIIVSVAFNFIPGPNGFSFADVLPASGSTVGAGAQMSVTSVSASTATSVGASSTAPGMSYSINASGNGFIEAAMAAQIQQGFGPVGWMPIAAPVFTFNTAGHTQAQIGAARLDPANFHLPAIPVFPPLVLFQRFEDVSSASGTWTFSKEMSFGSGRP